MEQGRLYLKFPTMEDKESVMEYKKELQVLLRLQVQLHYYCRM